MTTLDHLSVSHRLLKWLIDEAKSGVANELAPQEYPVPRSATVCSRRNHIVPADRIVVEVCGAARTLLPKRRDTGTTHGAAGRPTQMPTR